MRSVFPLLAASILLSACDVERAHPGFGQQPPSRGTPASLSPQPLEKPASVQVAATGGFRYTPESLAVRAESVVEIEFQNRDSQEHTFVLSELAVAMLAGAGQTVRSTVPIDRKNRGRFTFFCSIAGHREAGMEGTIEVR